MLWNSWYVFFAILLYLILCYYKYLGTASGERTEGRPTRCYANLYHANLAEADADDVNNSTNNNNENESTESGQNNNDDDNEERQELLQEIARDAELQNRVRELPQRQWVAYKGRRRMYVAFFLLFITMCICANYNVMFFLQWKAVDKSSKAYSKWS